MQFYTVCPCPNCRENIWTHDHFEAYRTKGQIKRYACFKCGEDLFLDRIPPRRSLEKADSRRQLDAKPS